MPNMHLSRPGNLSNLLSKIGTRLTLYLTIYERVKFLIMCCQKICPSNLLPDVFHLLISNVTENLRYSLFVQIYTLNYSHGVRICFGCLPSFISSHFRSLNLVKIMYPKNNNECFSRGIQQNSEPHHVLSTESILCFLVLCQSLTVKPRLPFASRSPLPLLSAGLQPALLCLTCTVFVLK